MGGDLLASRSFAATAIVDGMLRAPFVVVVWWRRALATSPGVTGCVEVLATRWAVWAVQHHCHGVVSVARPVIARAGEN